MLLESLREDEDIVQIYQTDIIGQTGHDQFHNAGKLAGCITESKTQHFKAPLPFSRDKGSFVMIPLIDISLPIAPPQIATAIVLAAIQGVETGIDFRQRELVLLNKFVNFRIVHTKSH